tara:strand:+ start:5158 stop:5412 length:255 start_codon:yes stop_codon:yes gene_type:complete
MRQPIDPMHNALRGFSAASVNMFAPKRSVITDMIMVQFLSIIVTLFFILVFKGSELTTNQVSMFLIGIFASIIMLGGIYTRISK